MTKRIAIILLAVATLASCIENDLPKPTVDLFIASLDVENTTGECVIDRATRTATIPLNEEANIEKVHINSIEFGSEVVTNIDFTPDMSQLSVSKDLNNHTLNMEQPEYITLSYFQTYEWKIVATQHINRIWTVDGQIGSTEWDVDGHRATVYRRNDYPLNNVVTTALRFGPRTVYDYPEIADMPTDFSENSERTITVSAFNEHVIWKLIIVPTEVAIDFDYVAAGANVIWIKSQAIDGTDVIFKYRKRGETEWIDLKSEWYATDANNPYNRYEEGFVKAVIRGLESGVEYEIIGHADEKQSDIKSVTTTTIYQMPNSQMEEWGEFTNDQNLLPTGEAGPCWYPFSSVQNMFWATGNPGSTSLGASYNLTYPAYKSVNPDNVPEGSTGEMSAFMGSKFVIVKFAAGNLFAGHYGETKGTNASVYFGQPINSNAKPVALRFKTKYKRGGINYVNSKAASVGTEYYIGSRQLKVVGGQPDVTKVFFGLTTWSEPHCVYSADETTFFDPRTVDGVFGLAYFDSDVTTDLMVENTEVWHTMTIPVEYSNPELVPTYLVLTFTCSGYGDYFTGGTESWMYVDDIELLYDLDDENMPK
ncbi:MAG: PCMD domain-containing protein [Alistipes sp.]|nr:PCMD domain-containing protein [Alistipes sp.]